MNKAINYKNLKVFTKKILLKIGLNSFSANAVAHGLCEASLRGVASHGIRLLPHYVNSALKGRKNPKPHFIFNLAALTDLEECEKDKENAWLTNGLGAENLALISLIFAVKGTVRL